MEGKKHERKISESSHGSSIHPPLKKAREEGDSSPIEEDSELETELTEGQEVTVPLRLNIGITPTPNSPQFIMSNVLTIARTQIGVPAQGTIWVGPFTTIGSGTMNWPPNIGSDQTVQGSGSYQAGDTGIREGSGSQQAPPEVEGLGIFRTQQNQGNLPGDYPPQGLPGGLLPQGPPGGQPPQGLPGGPPAGPPGGPQGGPQQGP